MRGVGLEPTCLAATGPKPVASANFASRALRESIFSGTAEAAFAPIGVFQLAGGDQSDFGELADHHLGDPVATFDLVGGSAAVVHDDTDLAPVSGINSSGGVGQHEVMFEGKSASGADLSLKVVWKFDEYPCGDEGTSFHRELKSGG